MSNSRFQTMRAVLVIALLGLASSADAATVQRPAWCALDDRLGWNFYCDPDAPPPDQPTEATPPAAVAPEDPRQGIKEIQDKLDWLKAEAILRPTPENIAAYIRYQQEQIERASTFSDQWRRVVWQSPDLDYTVRKPINTLGKQMWKDDRLSATQATLATLGERYGLFFFYAGNCLYCHAYSPVLKALSEKYGLDVVAVSLDGGALPEWPNALRDQGQSAAFGLAGKPVPATLLFDNATKQVVEVGYGLMSQSELEDRIYVLTQLQVGQDY